MSQNSLRLSWTFEEVDERLKNIMKNIYANAANAAEAYGMKGNLVAGANIAGFTKVADAMLMQGIVLSLIHICAPRTEFVRADRDTWRDAVIAALVPAGTDGDSEG